MAKKDYINKDYYDKLEASDWDALETWAKSTAGVTAGDIKKARAHEGWYFSKNRNQVQDLIDKYLESTEYKQGTLASRQQKEADKIKVDEADKLQQEGAQAIRDYKIDDFKFDESNEAMLAVKRAYAQNEQDTRRQIGQSMAQRGMSDSGLSSRINARLSAQTGYNVAQATGQEYLRQQQNWRQEQATKYNLAMAKYNMNSQLYQQAQNQYWQNLAVATENANRIYQQNMQNADKGTNWGGVVLGTGLMLGGLALEPFTAGASTAAVAAGTSLLTAGAGMTYNSIYN